MSDKKHTPTPWVYSPDRDTHDYIVHRAGAVPAGTVPVATGYITDADGVIGSSEWTWLTPEDAEFIVRACNAYDGLVARIAHLEEELRRLGRMP